MTERENKKKLKRQFRLETLKKREDAKEKMKHIFLGGVLILFLFLVSCNPNKPDKETPDFHCPPDSSMITVEGNLFLDSKGNIFLDFVDTKYNGKLKLVDKSHYKYIYDYYDDFLSIKNVDESSCKARIWGHIHTMTCID